MSRKNSNKIRDGTAGKMIAGIIGDLKSLQGKAMQEAGRLDIVHKAKMSVPYVIAGYYFDKVSFVFRHMKGSGIQRLLKIMGKLDAALKNPLPSINIWDILAGITGAAILKAIVYVRAKNAKKFRQGKEYGSARWSA